MGSAHDTHWPAIHVPQDQLDFYEWCEREEKANLSKVNIEARQRYEERERRVLESIIREGTPKPIEQSVSTEAYTPPALAFSDSDGVSISGKDPAWKGKEPVRRETKSQLEAGLSVPLHLSGHEVEVRHDVHGPGLPGNQWTEDLDVRPISDELGDAELQQALAEGILFQDK